MARLVVDVDDGRYIASAPMTFDELLDRWLAVKRADVEPTTVGLIWGAREVSEEFSANLWVLAATGCRRGEACAFRWTAPTSDTPSRVPLRGTRGRDVVVYR